MSAPTSTSAPAPTKKRKYNKKVQSSTSSSSKMKDVLSPEQIPLRLRSVSRPEVVLGTLNDLLSLSCSQDYSLTPPSETDETLLTLSPIPAQIINELLNILARALPTFSIPALSPPITPTTYDKIVSVTFTADLPHTPYDQLPADPIAKMVLTIFRNLSMVASNVPHFAYHSVFVTTMTTIVQDEHPQLTLLEHALVTLSNIASHLDVYGRRMFDWHHLTPPSPQGAADYALLGLAPMIAGYKSDTPLPKTVLLPFATHHITSVLGLFTTMNEIIMMDMSVVAKENLLCTLNILETLSTLPKNDPVFSHAPIPLALRLVKFLHLIKNGPDSIFYVSPTEFSSVDRVQPYLLYDSADNTVDTDFRDVSLSILYKCVKLTPAIRASVAEAPDCIERLLSIFTTRTGRYDARDLAASTLKLLVESSPVAKKTLLKYKRELVIMASKSEFLEHHIITCGLLPPDEDIYA
ncbi:hypothetical protein TL16_g06047 [Triparma laevis f. inornata]|uniref:Uncharacterized protein n=2 Tax=Triparma laevis TaxID=1534972 RepID=A0A9W6ZK22_9STRA|nr:hypothetical protein TrLO_g13999 [Triparma laevis f. longispina]GMH72932.1 hypothetical protein TL16_g06047 [Triparma laevis f. inornata]